MTTEELYQSMQSKPFLLAGPCVIENEGMILEIAERVAEIADKLGFIYVFKASFDKANRTSVDAFRGLGIDKGLEILQKVKDKFKLPLVTDIHESGQAQKVAEVVDILQIPAFLCRQTDLLLAAGQTQKIVNIKKAQFLTGNDMIYTAKKVESTGNKKIMLTERGNSYGNNNLVVDFRNLIDMQKFAYPLVMDVTHSTQKPGGEGGKSGGNREYAPYFANAAAAMGIQGFFFETHPNPDKALSDAANMIKLDDFEKILTQTMKHILANK